MRPYLLILLLAIATQGISQSTTPLKASETHALLHVEVTDFQAVPKPGTTIFFQGQNTNARIQGKTNPAGKVDILLPKGDTYTIKYQGFLDEKESSTIEVPSGKGLAEGTLQVQMEDETQETIALDIHFETGKATIRPESYPLLDQLVAAMKRNPKHRIELAGHTDSDGTEEANLLLSRDRANAAKAYLTQKGITPTRIEAVGHGEKMPVASNATETGKAQNRRTELRILQ